MNKRKKPIIRQSDNWQASYMQWGSVGLNIPIHAQFSRRAILTRKVGQTNLVFGVRWSFISRSVQVRLQVSVCNAYDLCLPA